MARIVWFHPRQLQPPRGGGDVRGIGLVRGALAAGHTVLLVHPDDGHELKEPTLPGLTIAQLRLKRGAWRLAAKVFSSDPLRAPRATGRSMASAAQIIRQFDPELGVVSQVMSRSIARRLLPDVPWIYDAHNVERELFEAHLALAGNTVNRLTFRIDLHRVSAAERKLVAESAAVLAVSREDALTLEHFRRGAAPVVVPSSVEPPPTVALPSQAPQTVLFVGTLDFPPNIEAITILVGTLMPEVVRRVPKARLLVVGRQPTNEVRLLLASQPWIDFVEDAPDLALMYERSRCAVLPFSSGAGTKLKLFEALAYGVPVVSTPTGVAGVDIKSGQECLIGTVPEAMVAHLVEMLVDPARADRLGTAARRAFDSRLSWPRAAYPKLEEVLESVASRR